VIAPLHNETSCATADCHAHPASIVSWVLTSSSRWPRWRRTAARSANCWR
jgi:hypothetical protein